ncbi:hypothetical protein [Prochlorococcus marinus]|nr:hypothetical protein [Prochlorococcus marinus]
MKGHKPSEVRLLIRVTKGFLVLGYSALGIRKIEEKRNIINY